MRNTVTACRSSSISCTTRHGPTGWHFDSGSPRDDKTSGRTSVPGREALLALFPLIAASEDDAPTLFGVPVRSVAPTDKCRPSATGLGALGGRKVSPCDREWPIPCHMGVYRPGFLQVSRRRPQSRRRRGRHIPCHMVAPSPRCASYLSAGASFLNATPSWPPPRRRSTPRPSGPSGPRGWSIRPGPSWRPSGIATTSAWPSSTTSWPSCWPASRRGARGPRVPR